MSILDNIKALVRRPTVSAGNTWAAWETTTPQYPQPSPYILATTGYRLNELVFSCIDKRQAAIAEASLRVYDDSDRANPEELEDHPLRELLARPNEAMGETEFWQAVEIYVDTAGFSVWEIELNRIGEPLALWPLRPDWCRFMRGQGRPLAVVRYEVPGMAPADIPIERCLVFQEFDPIYPMLKGLSRTAVALRVIAVDNANTDFLKVFFQNGAIINGLLKTESNVTEAEARRIRTMWREQHGGIRNWGEPAVLGQGLEYQPLQMNFKDMAFPELDARSESRICQVFDVPPILVGAKIGLDRATYSNYAEARKAFYQGPITGRWRWYASEMTQQLLPLYGTDKLAARFDTSDVEALVEDRTAQWERATSAAKEGLITRDEAREEMGLDPIDKTDVFLAGPEKGQTREEAQQAEADRMLEQQAQLNPQPGETPAGPGQPKPPPQDQAKALSDWRRQALEAVKNGQETPLLVGYDHMHADLMQAKTAGEVRAVFERHWPRPTAPTASEIFAELRRARLALERNSHADDLVGWVGR